MTDPSEAVDRTTQILVRILVVCLVINAVAQPLMWILGLPLGDAR